MSKVSGTVHGQRFSVEILWTPLSLIFATANASHRSVLSVLQVQNTYRYMHLYRIKNPNIHSFQCETSSTQHIYIKHHHRNGHNLDYPGKTKDESIERNTTA